MKPSRKGNRWLRPSWLATLAVLMVLGGILLAPAGCTSLQNRAAFFPERDFALRDEQLPPGVRRVAIATGDGETLEGFFVARPEAERLVLYFHGNGGNISQRVSELVRLAATGVNVLGVGYRGYGASTGSPSEPGIYRDGEAALGFARQSLGFTPDRIFLCGRSLGSVVAIRTAAGCDLAGLVLITPLTSGRDVARAHAGSFVAWAAGGSFDNLGQLARLRGPVLVIHGTHDEVIPFAQGEAVFAALTTPKRFVVIEGARHNDLEHHEPTRYQHELQRFFAAPAEAVRRRE